jgi:hypothetical protein
VSGHRHRTSSSAPLSTRIVVALGLAFIVGGFGLAGWQRLTEHDEDPSASPATSMFSAHLPNARTVAVYLLVIAAVAMAGALVLIRTRRRGDGL